ncbi:MAG: glutathione S-transferase N-terminal domain-containing protein [Caulobacterales bacterium]|nr:glutathione S-transferase N-terminal domain-containing protein [Caulobacterales bacterium]
MTKGPIEIHFWPTPNGKKVTIAAEEMGLDYVIRPVNIGAGEQFKPEFLAISPNNRMPAIVDPDGPGGEPISVFESGAILQYFGRKTGRFYPADERARVAVDEWLFWQMGGLGPMAGQANHFSRYAINVVSDEREVRYGIERYTNEVNRLYGVLERGLGDGRDFIAGDYSIADMAIWPWVLPKMQEQNIEDFPRLAAWHERVGARPAVERGKEVGRELRLDLAASGEEAERARAVLFGQRAT